MGFYGKTKTSFEFQKIIQKQMDEKMNELLGEMEEMTPVDTGKLKESYKLSKIDNFEYQISNGAKHAHQVLALGRVGKQGSEKLPDGILPFVSSFVSKN